MLFDSTGEQFIKCKVLPGETIPKFTKNMRKKKYNKKGKGQLTDQTDMQKLRKYFFKDVHLEDGVFQINIQEVNEGKVK